jgi:hypothetical protein
MERYAYSATSEIPDKSLVKILTISKTHEYWRQAFDCPNLEELTLNDPSQEQLAAMPHFRSIRRLRISFLRTPSIAFIAHCPQVEELILEYVSGFSDLSPLRHLKRLKSLHLENLRRVSTFAGLPNLEVFLLGFIINKSPFPALLPILHLTKLKKIHFGRATFKTPEYAFAMAAIPHVEGCNWELCWKYSGNYDFLGKRAGFVKQNAPNTEKRFADFVASFEQMKKEATVIVHQWKG